MNVRIEGQGRGIVHTIPRPGHGQQLPARAANEARGQALPGVRAAPDAPADGELFDANGDGVVESWSFAYGGDSFANFDPPPSGATAPPGPDPSKLHRTAGSQPDAASRGTGPQDHSAPRASTPVAVHKARDAYERDGLGNGPAPSAPVVRRAAPAPAPARAPASGPGG